MIHFIDSHPPPYTGATLLLLFFPLLFMLIAFAFVELTFLLTLFLAPGTFNK